MIIEFAVTDFDLQTSTACVAPGIRKEATVFPVYYVAKGSRAKSHSLVVKGG